MASVFDGRGSGEAGVGVGVMWYVVPLAASATCFIRCCSVEVRAFCLSDEQVILHNLCLLNCFDQTFTLSVNGLLLFLFKNVFAVAYAGGRDKSCPRTGERSQR